jgi:hypothetical protein
VGESATQHSARIISPACLPDADAAPSPNCQQAFISLSETAAASGFLALAAAAVAFGYLYLRRRFTVDSKSVYRQAMYRLNTHPGLLEVQGPTSPAAEAWLLA